ncbi:DUF2584 family protein [Pontibacillus litoralis]|uniref:DUF2584 domain-containing protein n=1 Tax=Pontibacillus litoralis JSM 072002 TaxID=1385512 RepID=A0A0A5G9P3_9BACI|nr:DUF2584 family protein [Pontibacillus litoralis]KGX87898.1 hypothetical protein N784_12375 [Pontibacillus litoralis JSM 072002]
MSMPLIMQWVVITEGKEQRVGEKDNLFTLELPGYTLFPVDQSIEMKRMKESEQTGIAKIVELTWSNQKTVIVYELISLHSVN